MKYTQYGKIAAISVVLWATTLNADDVTDTIDEAVVAYKSGEFTKATEDLTYALELIKQKKGQNMKAYLPEPLDGWNAEDATSQTAGSAMFGGGTMLGRSYRKGDASITIEMVTDSPLLQSIGMMFANPMFASSDGGELTRINKEKAIVKYNASDKSGEIKILLDGRILITVSGNNVSKEDLTAYAEAIDAKKIKQLQ